MQYIYIRRIFFRKCRNTEQLTSHASHNTANVICDSKEMCDCHGVQQLVLGNAGDINKVNSSVYITGWFKNHNINS